jgi:hypothetical protein
MPLRTLWFHLPEYDRARATCSRCLEIEIGSLGPSTGIEFGGNR